MNQFLQKLTKKDTVTENGAISNSSTGSQPLDQFGNAGAYRGRDYNEVAADMSVLWSIDPLMAMKFAFYLRLITRRVKPYESDGVQKGQGQRDEFYKRMLWVLEYHPDAFYKNLALVPLFGSYRDVFMLICYAHVAKVKIDYTRVFNALLLTSSVMGDKSMFWKYAPRIRSNAVCTTEYSIIRNEVAKALARHLNLTYEEYRRAKSSAPGHEFQQLITQGKFGEIDFSTIPGIALNKMINSKFLANQKLEEKYLEWLKTQNNVKFNGYPFQLIPTGQNRLKNLTMDLQFEHLLKTGRDSGGIQGNVWCALDTSGSMEWKNPNLPVTAYQLCLSLGIYFSSLNEGAFKDHVIMFDNVSKTRRLHGSYTEKYNQIGGFQTAWGSTNFQSVIDEIVRVRKQFPDIPVSDFPQTLIVVSDMQFNPTGTTSTNYESAMQKLRDVDLPNMRIIWWDVTGRKTDFPSTIEDEGTFVFSGFDGAILSILLGGDNNSAEKKAINMEEAFKQALNQPIFQHISL